jgi:chromate transporter
VTYGSTPAAQGVLYGIVPVVIAIIAHALVGLLRTVIKTVWLAALAVAALAAYLFGVNELLILATGALLVAAVHVPCHPPGGQDRVRGLLSFGGSPLFPDPTGGSWFSCSSRC